MSSISDPYATLGVKPGASDAEVRAAYRRQVQLHHPDHNGGSAESARKFEEVQEAYARVRQLRASAAPRPSEAGRDPDLDSRLAEIERELARARAAAAERLARAAQAQRERDAAHDRARAAAREAASADGRARPSDEELGYFKTDDSFSKILADAAAELSGRLSGAAEQAAEKGTRGSQKHRVADRVADLLDELGSKLGSDRPDR